MRTSSKPEESVSKHAERSQMSLTLCANHLPQLLVIVGQPFQSGFSVWVLKIFTNIHKNIQKNIHKYSHFKFYTLIFHPSRSREVVSRSLAVSSSMRSSSKPEESVSKHAENHGNQEAQRGVGHHSSDRILPDLAARDSQVWSSGKLITVKWLNSNLEFVSSSIFIRWNRSLGAFNPKGNNPMSGPMWGWLWWVVHNVLHMEVISTCIYCVFFFYLSLFEDVLKMSLSLSFCQSGLVSSSSALPRIFLRLSFNVSLICNFVI